MGNGRCLIEAHLANEIHAGGESASTVKVHPALATVDVPAQTSAAARPGNEQRRRARHVGAGRAHRHGTDRGAGRPAAHEPGLRKVRQAVRELHFGRPESADRNLYEQLQKAAGEHTARMQLTGTHHRLAERGSARTGTVTARPGCSATRRPGRGHRGPDRRRRPALPAQRPARRALRRGRQAAEVDVEHRAGARSGLDVPDRRTRPGGAAHARPGHVRDAQAVGVRRPRRRHQRRRGGRHAARGLLPPEHRRSRADREGTPRVQRHGAARGQARARAAEEIDHPRGARPECRRHRPDRAAAAGRDPDGNRSSTS